MNLSKLSLYDLVVIEGKNYITSHLFHEQTKPTESISATNRKIRSLSIFKNLKEDGHIVEVSWSDVKNEKDCSIKDIIISNSYKPIMLLDERAQQLLKLKIVEDISSLVENSSREALFEVIEHEGKKLITSQKFHADVKPTEFVYNTNRAIRNMPTYDRLSQEGHVIEINSDSSPANLAYLVKLNKNNPIMLLDPVAQKEAEHHFKVTSTQAVTSSKESAMLGLLGIDLAVLAENQEALQAVKDIHDAQRDGKPLPIAQLKKTPFTKRLDEALSAAKKLKQLSKAVSVPYSSTAILKIIGEEYELDLEGLRANDESTQAQQLESIPSLPSLPPCKSEWMLPKDLAKYLTEHIGISFSAQKVNQLLVDADLQVSKGSNGSGPYQVTEKGSEISTQTEVQVSTFKGIKLQYQIHWDRDRTLEEITDYIEI